MIERQAAGGKRRRGCLFLLAGFIGIGAVGALIGKLNAPQETELDRAERARFDGDLATLARGQEAIRAILKDPSSADFSDGFGRVKHGQHVACGYVNGRNSFGAMAGSTPWLVIAEKNTFMVRSFDNQRAFVRTWNEYCTGPDDRDKPIPAEMFGVRLGSRPPAVLKPFERNSDVLVFSGPRPKDYLGVPLRDAWFTAHQGRVVGGSASAHGPEGYDRWRAALFSRYGAPTSIGDGDRGIVEWKPSTTSAQAQLSYNPTNDQSLLTILIPVP